MLPKKDLILISHLRKNARETLTKLSRKTKIPISTIFDRLKEYENGIIINHATLINFSELGYSTRANIIIKVGKEQREEMKIHLEKSPFVNTAYKINNGYDFMVECIFKNINELHNFVENLEERFEVQDKQVYYVIEEIKKEKFLTDLELLEL